MEMVVHENAYNSNVGVNFENVTVTVYPAHVKMSGVGTTTTHSATTGRGIFVIYVKEYFLFSSRSGM